MSQRRVVVTGLGLVTPLGVGVKHVWNNILSGKSGITGLCERFSQLPCRIAGLVPRGSEEGEFDVDEWVHSSIKGATSPFIHYALSASKQALDDCGWVPNTDEERERAGVAIGSAMGHSDEIAKSSETLATRGYRRLSPFSITKLLPNLAAGQVSIAHGFRGPNHCVSTACTSGGHAIGDAFRFIKFGDADVMIAGGSESGVEPLNIALFSRCRAVATNFNDDPERASRPFDKDRSGFVMGEGAGCMVLEEYEHAKARNAHIYAEVLGYGLGSDAFHVTAPSPDGRGAYTCMRNALKYSGLGVDDITYINAHATSTPLGDAIENSAIKRLFDENGGDWSKLSVSSSKGHLGHMLGAAGAVEAILSCMAVHTNVIPPTANLENLSEGFDLNYVPLEPQEREVQAALSNSFGFGGTNAALIFKKI